MKIIKSNKASLVTGGGLRLVPGINQVQDAVWENALGTFTIKQMLKDKVLVDQTPSELKRATLPEVKAEVIERDGDEEEERPRQPSVLKLLAQGRAVEMVKETLDLVLLEDWEAQEERVKVTAAIKSQIKRIREETKKPKDKETDEGEEG